MQPDAHGGLGRGCKDSLHVASHKQELLWSNDSKLNVEARTLEERPQKAVDTKAQ